MKKGHCPLCGQKMIYQIINEWLFMCVGIIFVLLLAFIFVQMCVSGGEKLIDYYITHMPPHFQYCK